MSCILHEGKVRFVWLRASYVISTIQRTAVLKFHEVLFNICVFDNDKSGERNQAGHVIKMVTILASNN